MVRTAARPAIDSSSGWAPNQVLPGKGVGVQALFDRLRYGEGNSSTRGQPAVSTPNRPRKSCSSHGHGLCDCAVNQLPLRKRIQQTEPDAIKYSSGSPGIREDSRFTRKLCHYNVPPQAAVPPGREELVTTTSAVPFCVAVPFLSGVYILVS